MWIRFAFLINISMPKFFGLKYFYERYHGKNKDNGIQKIKIIIDINNSFLSLYLVHKYVYQRSTFFSLSGSEKIQT